MSRKITSHLLDTYYKTPDLTLNHTFMTLNVDVTLYNDYKIRYHAVHPIMPNHCFVEKYT